MVLKNDHFNFYDNFVQLRSKLADSDVGGLVYIQHVNTMKEKLCENVKHQHKTKT